MNTSGGAFAPAPGPTLLRLIAGGEKVQIPPEALSEFAVDVLPRLRRTVAVDMPEGLFAEPDILILDEPTRGIDVGAKYEIYCIINNMVSQGKSVIFISSEMPEILGMCDRIYIMNAGKMIGEMNGKDATQENIMSCIINSDKGIKG